MQITFLLAGAIFLISLLPPPVPVDNADIKAAQKIVGGIAIGTCIGLLGGLLGTGGGVFVVPLLIYVLKTPTKIAAASSTFIVCFSSLTGFLVYVSMERSNRRRG